MLVEKLKEVINSFDELKEIIGDHGILKTIIASSIILFPFYLPYLRRLLLRSRNQESDENDDNLANKERSGVTSTTENQTDDSRLEQERMNENVKRDEVMEIDTVDKGDQGVNSQCKNNQKKKENEGDVPKHSTTFNNSEVAMHIEGNPNFNTPVTINLGKK